jgi:hypothetical protein
MTSTTAGSLELGWNNVPLDLAADVMIALDRAVRRAGYTATFREETGFGRVYFERDSDTRVITGAFEAADRAPGGQSDHDA